jgi:DNA-binding HxlR family transcriptional regulator
MVMVRRTSHKNSTCSLARSLDALGPRWSLLIVRSAFAGSRRFGEFQTSLGLAKNVLTVRLRGLVAHGIMETVPASDGTRYKEYVLTEKGRGVFPVLVAIQQWGEDFCADWPKRHAQAIEMHRQRPVKI